MQLIRLPSSGSGGSHITICMKVFPRGWIQTSSQAKLVETFIQMHNSGRNLPLLDMLENGCLLWKLGIGKLGTERLLHELCYFHQLPPLKRTQILAQCAQEIRQFIQKTLYLKPGHQHSFPLSFHHDIRSLSQPENLVNMYACIYFNSLRVVEPNHGLTWLTFISEGRWRITVTEKRFVECNN